MVKQPAAFRDRADRVGERLPATVSLRDSPGSGSAASGEKVSHPPCEVFVYLPRLRRPTDISKLRGVDAVFWGPRNHTIANDTQRGLESSPR